MKDILPPLQFLILDYLITINQKMSGRQLREFLLEKGIKRSGPAFYQLMARLKKSKYIDDQYGKLKINNQIVYERIYMITQFGKTSYKNTKAFYGNNK